MNQSLVNKFSFDHFYCEGKTSKGSTEFWTKKLIREKEKTLELNLARKILLKEFIQRR